MNAKQRAQAAYAKLLKKVEAALAENPKAWGFRVDPPDYGISDGVTYNADDLDTRPQFVKDDDKKWNS